jgi:GH15 family glucan-1,4-alpha-glucosidase
VEQSAVFAVNLASAPQEPRRSQADPGSRNPSKYLPIRDYALIGDCHGCALVSRSGSIDWCTFGRFDAPPSFCRLLDAEKGGFLSTTPADAFEAQRAYLDGTNILRTVLTTATGKIAITDYMLAAAPLQPCTIM